MRSRSGRKTKKWATLNRGSMNITALMAPPMLLNQPGAMKPKIIILTLLLGVPGAMFLARLILAPVVVTAESSRDNYIAAELRAELLRIYQKRYVYPESLGPVWSDLLQDTFIPAERTNAFSYQSTGQTYEFSFTNGGNLIIDRGINGAASREVVKLETGHQ